MRCCRLRCCRLRSRVRCRCSLRLRVPVAYMCLLENTDRQPLTAIYVRGYLANVLAADARCMCTLAVVASGWCRQAASMVDYRRFYFYCCRCHVAAN